MAKSEQDKNVPARPVPRLPKGFRDIGAAEIREQQAMLAKIRGVYERYGFEPLETPPSNTPTRWASSYPTRTARTKACFRSRRRRAVALAAL